jgi:FtsP/CotA-like multicopper oxidase with cupredoxin domain
MTFKLCFYEDLLNLKDIMKRREFLIASLVAPGAFLLKGCGGSGGINMVSSSGISAPAKFIKQLLIPSEINPDIIDNKKTFDLDIRPGQHTFFDGMLTDTYCVDVTGGNNQYLAPTLRMRNGDNVQINYANNLGEETTMHGHGMHVPADMDGGPHQKITAGGAWEAIYTVKQKSCTNWYHPHLMGTTAQHVYKGLTGLIIIEDSESDTLDLPKTYGVDDIPLIIQDRVFDGSGQLDYSPSTMEIMHGHKGDMFMINGVITPFVSVEAKQIRFRILNASNSRIYNFVLDTGKTFTQIATDNAFLESGVSLTSLRLSPSERAEIVVDFSSNADQSFILKDLDSGAELMKINVDKPLVTATTTMPSALTTLTKFAYDSSTTTRSFVLDSDGPGLLQINGVSMDMAIINERIPVDQIEVWEVTNNMPMAHNFHIHATHFWVIERDGSSANVPSNEQGYKDVVRIDGGKSLKFVVKMVDYVDSDNPYMFHCHILEHEDAGMMGQFIVE